MITCEIVETGKLLGGLDAGYGFHRFVTTPRVGERIVIVRHDKIARFDVIRVEHHPLGDEARWEEASIALYVKAAE